MPPRTCGGIVGPWFYRAEAILVIVAGMFVAASCAFMKPRLPGAVESVVMTCGATGVVVLAAATLPLVGELFAAVALALALFTLYQTLRMPSRTTASPQ